MEKSRTSWISILFGLMLSTPGLCQHADKLRPEEWSRLVPGVRFMDRILPAPIYQGLEHDVWGADGVVPRDMHNGIEDPEWSYWGGKPIVAEDGRYHFFVCRWREDDPRGHMAWPDSEIVHAVGNRPTGPFSVVGPVGKGHFPEVTRLPDGRFAVFHFNGCYVSSKLDGPWVESGNEFGFHHFKDPTIFGSLIIREDGGLLMIDRYSRMWLKLPGEEKFRKVSGQIRPDIPGKYEDPLIWRTEVQYHLLLNDWWGRTAYHFRSKDGVNWKMDAGEAYTIGIYGYTDGTRVDWYKYERPKVLQDEHGRATHLYFAVVDIHKRKDFGNDRHSSKNIALPLVVGRRMEVLRPRTLDELTETIEVRIIAEEDFDPHRDMDMKSLRFGAPEKVDFGKGGKPVSWTTSGADLVVTFAVGEGFDDSHFAGKLIGRKSDQTMLFGFSRLPWVDHGPYVPGEE